MHLKKNVEISTLSKGITHGRGFESQNQAVIAQAGKAVSPTDVGLNRKFVPPRITRASVSPTDVGLNR